MRVWLVLFIFMASCLCGCTQESQVAPVESQEAIVEAQEAEVEKQVEKMLVVDKLDAVEQLKSVASEIYLMYNSWNNPTLYPADEHNLDVLRTLIKHNNELNSTVFLNYYDIGIYSGGFMVKIEVPRDAWGNPYYLWLENDGVKNRITLTSSGEDGIITFNGVTESQVSNGFGDDLLLFLDSVFG